MSKLSGPRVAPRSGQTRGLVVFLHGYGADGHDLIGLADPLAPHLPDVAFRAPNAPQRSVVNPGGYQWFPVSWIDGSPESAMKAGMRAAAHTLDAWLTETMAAEGVTPAQTALVGFSQGTIMSLHVAPRRPEPVAGIVGFSGRLAEPELLATELVCRPPVLLVHGDQDQVIPVGALHEAREALGRAGIDVCWHISRGVAHGIAPDGLELALEFLQTRLG